MTNAQNTHQKPWYKQTRYILLLISSPISVPVAIALWYITIPVIGIMIYKSKKYPKFNKAIPWFVLAVLCLTLFASYDTHKTTKEAEALILAGKFSEAEKRISYRSSGKLSEYKYDLNKLKEDGIQILIDNLANKYSTDYKTLIETLSFSEFDNIDQKVKEQLLSRTSEIEERRNELAKKIKEEIQLTIDDINNGAVDLFDIPKRINKFSPDNQFTKNEFNKLVPTAKTYQRNNYPNSRKEFAKETRSKLWREDYEVYVSGPGNSTITFVNWRFSANANIEDFHNVYKFLLEKERFKKVIYKSSEYGGGISYTLNTEKDDVILGLET